MRKFVIWSHAERAFVARGAERTYTADVRRARQWPTKADAQAQCQTEDKVEAWRGIAHFNKGDQP